MCPACRRQLSVTWRLATTFAAAVLGTALSRPLGRMCGVMDHPGALKLQTKPIPRLGGLGILAGFLIGAVLEGGVVRSLLGGALVMFAVGVLDDRFGLRPIWKLGGQIMASLFLAHALSQTVQGRHEGIALLSLFTASVTVVFANAVNLIDGMDGLAASTATIGFIALATLQYMHGVEWHVSLISAVAVLGFLPLNLPRAKVFMGDCGSLLVGFLLAYGLIELAARSVGLFASGLIILAIPLFDLGTGILRRWLTKRSIFSGDREHFYDRLRGTGIGDTKVLGGILLAAVLFGLLGILLSFCSLSMVILTAITLGAFLIALAWRLGWLGRDSTRGQLSCL
jgi:UDP-GlcNAc:undecaprenyl-phosphate GlcNAc-1-phosphate transferase